MADRQLLAYALIVLLVAAIPAFWWWVRRRFRQESGREDRHLRIDLSAGRHGDSGLAEGKDPIA